MENTNSVKRLDIKIESVDWSRTFSYEITELELMGGGVITFQVPEDIPKLSTYAGVKTGATLGLAIGGSVGSLMARIARVVATGLPHHVTQRGVARMPVFCSHSAREVYLCLLREHSRRHQLRVLAYCLMTNHIHLLAIPDQEDSLSRTLRYVHGRFAQ